MNLARHAAVLWRFRGVTAAGLALGLCLAVLASYEITPSGVHARGVSVYASESQILVTQPGFPEGRVTLPTGATGDSPVNPTAPARDEGGIQFADPGRFSSLADLYTHLLATDRVRARIPGHPAPDVIAASLLPAVSGSPVLPIIQLITNGGTPKAAETLNVQSFNALRDTLVEDQRDAGIQPAQRVKLSVIKAPKAGALLTGPSHTASILAFILCLIGTIAVTHLLAALRDKPAEETAGYDGALAFWNPDQLQGEPRLGSVSGRAAASDPLRS